MFQLHMKALRSSAKGRGKEERGGVLMFGEWFVWVGVIVDIDKCSRTASLAEIFQQDARLLVELFERCGGGFAE